MGKMTSNLQKIHTLLARKCKILYKMKMNRKKRFWKVHNSRRNHGKEMNS